MSEVETLRAELACARSEIGGLRLRIEALELSHRAALADKAAKAPRVVAPLARALAGRPGVFGLRTGLGD